MRDDFLQAEDEVLLKDCIQDFHKASGNGGQKVNKTSSAVRLTHIPTGFIVHCAESRSQHENRHLALKKLREKMALELREEADLDFRTGDPAPALTNPRYYLWEAKVLDLFIYAEGDLKKAALLLGTTPTKLAKLFFRDKALWEKANSLSSGKILPPKK